MPFHEEATFCHQSRSRRRALGTRRRVRDVRKEVMNRKMWCMKARERGMTWETNCK